MRRMLLLAALALSLTLTAPAGEKKPKLAVSLPGSVEFFMVQRKGMDKAAAELGVELV